MQRENGMVESRSHEHVVQFYENDAYLIAKLAEYLVAGLERGETGIVIATPEHRQALARTLNEKGLKPEGLELKGLLVLLDARETLNRVLQDDFPDESLFREVISRILVDSGFPRKRVCAYGEMVGLLWSEGKEDAAVRLEDLWEGVLGGASASLLCAYPLRGMSGSANLRPFRDICARHTHVLPSESFSSPALTDDERRRMVAELQQRAATLESQAQEMDRLLEDVRQLHTLTFKLNATASLDETLHEILRHALSVYRARQGLLSVPAGEGIGLRVAASIGFTPALLEAIESVAPDKGAHGFSQLSLMPVIVEDTGKKPGGPASVQCIAFP
jgi:hypothetical protein